MDWVWLSWVGVSVTFFRLLMGWVECGYECQMLKERSEVSADVIIIIIAI